MKNTLPVVLLVCKDPMKIAFFKEILKGTFSLISVNEALEGVDWVKNTPIEILILDSKTIENPLEEICKAVKKTTKGKTLPILLLSNTLKQANVLEALNAGITDFLHEPLEALEIHERIAVCLYSRLINKKMRLVRSKIKTAPFIARNSKMLLDKRFIRDKTLQIIATAKKGAVPLSVLMLHIDSFSRLQETVGEIAIVEIFRFLEKFLQTRLRKYDTLLTEGPGQYLILLPKTSQSAAKVIAEDMRKEISTTTISTSVKEVLLTVSIGVVAFEKELSKSAKDFEQFDLCLERVKKSLIRAQKKGNTIISKT